MRLWENDVMLLKKERKLITVGCKAETDLLCSVMSYLVFILFAIYWLIILIKKVNINCSFVFWLTSFEYDIGLQWKGPLY